MGHAEIGAYRALRAEWALTLRVLTTLEAESYGLPWTRPLSMAEFRENLEAAHGVLQSMGRTGVCWDNALAESFFATYKLELIEPASWPTRARARTATVQWLEAIYNRQRRHSAIDMLSPVDYEERYWERRAAA